MASLCAAGSAPMKLGFKRLIFKAETPLFSPIPLKRRFRNTVRLEIRQGLHTVFASNSNPLGEESLKEKSNGIKTSEAAAQGPPFLTILAGLLVFSLICWIIGSIVMWLIGLIVKVPPLK